ncbi:proteoglycan 4-like, partial [Hypanus sabinus]|uniref:proteoglycan 4-like n=1 Tax=Hypanus sabinus TaxID=79690 RepID=UPI0028C42401
PGPRRRLVDRLSGVPETDGRETPPRSASDPLPTICTGLDPADASPIGSQGSRIRTAGSPHRDRPPTLSPLSAQAWTPQTPHRSALRGPGDGRQGDPTAIGLRPSPHYPHRPGPRRRLADRPSGVPETDGRETPPRSASDPLPTIRTGLDPQTPRRSALRGPGDGRQGDPTAIGLRLSPHYPHRPGPRRRLADRLSGVPETDGRETRPRSASDPLPTIRTGLDPADASPIGSQRSRRRTAGRPHRDRPPTLSPLSAQAWTPQTPRRSALRGPGDGRQGDPTAIGLRPSPHYPHRPGPRRRLADRPSWVPETDGRETPPRSASDPLPTIRTGLDPADASPIGSQGSRRRTAGRPHSDRPPTLSPLSAQAWTPQTPRRSALRGPGDGRQGDPTAIGLRPSPHYPHRPGPRRRLADRLSGVPETDGREIPPRSASDPLPTIRTGLDPADASPISSQGSRRRTAGSPHRDRPPTLSPLSAQAWTPQTPRLSALRGPGDGRQGAPTAIGLRPPTIRTGLDPSDASSIDSQGSRRRTAGRPHSDRPPTLSPLSAQAWTPQTPRRSALKGPGDGRQGDPTAIGLRPSPHYPHRPGPRRRLADRLSGVPETDGRETPQRSASDPLPTIRTGLDPADASPIGSQGSRRRTAGRPHRDRPPTLSPLSAQAWTPQTPR